MKINLKEIYEGVDETELADVLSISIKGGDFGQLRNY